jgi:GntR family transcriptional regulator, transcriptional repressor for pyruvate dehydrogenase complex
MEAYSVPVMQKDTLSDQVIRFLLGMISDKQLKVGDTVPSEGQVAQLLKVSRNVVRESYRALAVVGVLSVQSGKKPRIREIDPKVLAQFFSYAAATSQVSAQQILELRRVIEIQTAALAASNATDEELQRIREAGQCLHELPLSDPEWIHCDYALHLAIADAVHNPLFPIQLLALRAPLEESMRIGMQSMVSSHTESSIVMLHDRLVQAICSRDSVAAGYAMEQHFLAPVSAMLNLGVAKLNAEKVLNQGSQS